MVWEAIFLAIIRAPTMKPKIRPNLINKTIVFPGILEMVENSAPVAGKKSLVVIIFISMLSVK
jgi:hypothetical protein